MCIEFYLKWVKWNFVVVVVVAVGMSLFKNEILFILLNLFKFYIIKMKAVLNTLSAPFSTF